jgi:hypothetical protein
MLEKKVKEENPELFKGKTSFFLYVNNNVLTQGDCRIIQGKPSSRFMSRIRMRMVGCTSSMGHSNPFEILSIYSFLFFFPVCEIQFN